MKTHTNIVNAAAKIREQQQNQKHTNVPKNYEKLDAK